MMGRECLVGSPPVEMRVLGERRFIGRGIGGVTAGRLPYAMWLTTSNQPSGGQKRRHPSLA